MCQHLNIQASNPCTLLTQEHAKKFLHHGNEEDRYHFFLQAANLQSQKEHLGTTLETLKSTKEALAESQKQNSSLLKLTEGRHDASLVLASRIFEKKKLRNFTSLIDVAAFLGDVSSKNNLLLV